MEWEYLKIMIYKLYIILHRYPIPITSLQILLYREQMQFSSLKSNDPHLKRWARNCDLIICTDSMNSNSYLPNISVETGH